MLPVSEPMSFQTGLDGFIWWIGVVVNLCEDPLHIGRARVRILGWHGEEDDIPTHLLPWAVPLRPVTHSDSLPSYREGDWVVGFFLDGKLAQEPIIMGVLPAIPQRQLSLPKPPMTGLLPGLF